MRVVKTLVLLIVGGAVIALLSLMYFTSVRSQIRVVHPDGAWMAVDQAGLARLNALYAASPECRKRLTESTRDPGLVVGCRTPQVSIIPVPRADVSGLVPLKARTQATALAWGFLLPDGRVVEPYAANRFELEAAGIVEVEKIRLHTTGTEGWVETYTVHKICCGL
jgi:hypothetical protein